MANNKTLFPLFRSGFFVAIMCCLLFIPDNIIAGKKPDFSGEWNLNTSESELGEFNRAASKIKITQDENSLTIERTGTRRNGEVFTYTEKITLDGKESVNTVFGDRQRKAVAEWSEDGLSLIISSTMNFERDGETREVKSQETWILTDNGKSIVIDSSSTTPRGERKQKLVYNKG